MAAAVMTAAFLLWGILHVFSSQQGQQVTVTQDGKILGVYDLTEENTLTFSDENSGTNRLAIHYGEAYMEEADCPDKLCMRQKPISGKGESIICLPHRLAVEVTAGAEAETDAVVR